MKLSKSTELSELTSTPWWWISIRGMVMLFLGGGIAVMCIAASDVFMTGAKFPWIPIMGGIVFIAGVFRSIDAYISVSVPGFLLNIQSGILDMIVGAFILFNVDGEPSKLAYLIGAYLLSQGLFRNIFLSVVTIRNPISNRITGLISIILGILLGLGLPTSEPWFIAFSLSVDIGFRGWALIMLASSLNKETVVDT